MTDYHHPLYPNQIYHIFSRAVGNEILFLSDENYKYFLQKLKQHTSHVCELFAYALIPNHFHLLARINDEKTIIQHFETTKNTPYKSLQHSLPDFIMERFSNFLNSYSKAFNKKYNRKGALFMNYLKRNIVRKDADFSNYIWYIHKNAVHHQLSQSIGEWPFDSYASML